MKCFYHPVADAVGTCGECGKATCGACVRDVGGALRCRDCVQRAREAPARSSARFLARARRIGLVGMACGWLLVVVAGATGDTGPVASPLVRLAGLLGAGLIMAYIFWAGYWGFHATWSTVRTILGRLGIILWIPCTWPLFGFVVALCTTYGVYGAGIYQYLRHKRIVGERRAGVRNVLAGAALACLMVAVAALTQDRAHAAGRTASPAPAAAVRRAPSRPPAAVPDHMHPSASRPAPSRAAPPVSPAGDRGPELPDAVRTALDRDVPGWSGAIAPRDVAREFHNRYGRAWPRPFLRHDLDGNGQDDWTALIVHTPSSGQPEQVLLAYLQTPLGLVLHRLAAQEVRRETTAYIGTSDSTDNCVILSFHFIDSPVIHCLQEGEFVKTAEVGD